MCVGIDERVMMVVITDVARNERERDDEFDHFKSAEAVLTGQRSARNQISFWRP